MFQGTSARRRNNPQFTKINESTENRWFLFQKHKFLAVAKFALRSSTDRSWERAVSVPSWGPAALERGGDPHSTSQLMLPPPSELAQLSWQE